MQHDILVVGAGLSGAVIAERYAAMGKKVLVLEKRAHLAGNCYDFVDAHGIRRSQYGAHLFHTNSQKVWHYLQAFAKWRPYEHRVLAQIGTKMYPLPINLTTLNAFFQLNLTDEPAMRQFLAQKALPARKTAGIEGFLLSQIGPELYEAFFKSYTEKQWGLSQADLSVNIVKRLPLRFSTDDRYFTDFYQALPESGMTGMVEKMLASDKIEVRFDSDFFALRPHLPPFEKVFYTGPLDQYFNYQLGRLEYRSLRFEWKEYQLASGKNYHQLNSVINYPEKQIPYTRSVEYKYFYPPEIKTPWTVVSREYPTWEGEPYYPVPRPRNARLATQYQSLVKQEEAKGIYFLGRLGSYRYLNMDQAIAEALGLFEKLSK